MNKTFQLINKNENFLSKELDILKRIGNFFNTNIKYIKTMLSIIEGKSNISIRVLDWFVANYSKKNDTYYKLNYNGKENLFYIHIEYKNQLNGYKKDYFDPFCRKKKLIYYYQSDKKDINFITSIGQLNFFQWAISKKIIMYVENNLDFIEEDMKITNKLNRIRKQHIHALNNSDDDESDNYEIISSPDPMICSSETVSSFCIGQLNDEKEIKKKKRQQLSKSAYTSGIKKSHIKIRLDFE